MGFANQVANGGFVRAIRTPQTASKPRSWFDKMNGFAVESGMGGLGYITFAEEGNKGPIAKNLDAERIERLQAQTGAQTGDSVFFVCGKGDKTAKFAGQVRTLLGNELQFHEGGKRSVKGKPFHNNQSICLRNSSNSENRNESSEVQANKSAR